MCQKGLAFSGWIIFHYTHLPQFVVHSSVNEHCSWRLCLSVVVTNAAPNRAVHVLTLLQVSALLFFIVPPAARVP